MSDEHFRKVGLLIGHAQRDSSKGIHTGCTVILLPDESLACVDIRGFFLKKNKKQFSFFFFKLPFSKSHSHCKSSILLGSFLLANGLFFFLF